MALLLSGERPSAAAVAFHPLRLLANWIAKARAANARRQAMTELLALEAHRLDDIGVNRTDLFDAISAQEGRGGRLLSDRRSRNSSHWLNP